MARKHARLLLRIWDDPDWLRLSSAHQTTYLALLGSVDLSWCGVAPLLPQRLVGKSADLVNERKVKTLLDGLQAEPGRFLVIDDSTAEVLVRTYVRHDEIMRQPNVAKAMVRAIAKVHSGRLVKAIEGELRRMYRDNPDLNGWDAVEYEDAELFEKVSANPLRRVS
jgi:hypothetical protein